MATRTPGNMVTEDQGGEKQLRRSPRARHSIIAPEHLSFKATEIRFGEEEVVAIKAPATKTKRRKSGPESDQAPLFRVAQLEMDVVVGDPANLVVQVEWLDAVDGEEAKFKRGKTGTVEVSSIICPLTDFINDAEDGHILLAQEALARIQSNLSPTNQDAEETAVGDAAYARRLRARYRRLQREDNLTDDDDDDNEGEEIGDDDDDDAGATPSRKRKRRKSTSKAKSPRKRGGKNALHPRPSVPQKEELFKVKTEKLESFQGDRLRAGKEVIRAVLAQDHPVLEAVLKKEDLVYSLHAPHCVDFPVSALTYAAVQNQVETMKVLMDNWRKKFSLPQSLLGGMTTGNHTSRFSSYNRRKINASRGGKEGNNAFLKDCGEHHVGRLEMGSKSSSDLHANSELSFVPNWMMLLDAMEPETMSFLCTSDKIKGSLEVEDVVEHLVDSGERVLAARVLQDLLAWNTSFSNFLHLESLGDEGKGKFSKEFRASQVLKKAGTRSRFTPLHTAALNPDVGYLQELLVVAPDSVHTTDERKRGLLHFAATSKSDAATRYLLTTFPSLDRTVADSQGLTPLIAAAMCARASNITALLQDVPEETKNKMLAAHFQGVPALHWASLSKRKGSIETVRALLDFGALPSATATAVRNKLTPAHFAAMMGNLEVLKILHQADAKLNAKDKLKRTPITLAAKNGHVHVVAYLLKVGVDAQAADSSGNTPLMYAAAYGWHECAELLIEHGEVDINEANAWKSTALSLAIQKHHPMVTSLLLHQPQVDVNFVNENGETLVFSLIIQYVDQLRNMRHDPNQANIADKDLLDDLPAAVRLLLDKETCKVGIPNATGRTELHLIADKATVSCDLAKRKLSAVMDLLVKHKIDIDALDSDGVSALAIAASNRNVFVTQLLIEHGAKLTVDARNRTILHCLTEACESGTLELIKLLSQSRPTIFNEMCVAFDSSGAAPIHNVTRVLIQKGSSGYSSYSRRESRSRYEDILLFLLEKVPATACLRTTRTRKPIEELGLEWDNQDLVDEETFLRKIADSVANKDNWSSLKPPPDSPHGKNLLHLLAELPLSEETIASLGKVLSALPQDHRQALRGSRDMGGCTLLQRLLLNFAKEAERNTISKEGLLLQVVRLLIDRDCATEDEVNQPSLYPFESEVQATAFTFTAEDDQALCKELWSLYSARGEQDKFDELFEKLTLSRRRAAAKAAWKPFHVLPQLVGKVSVDLLKKMCNEYKCSFDLILSNGDTLLHLACKRGCRLTVQFLCKMNKQDVVRPNHLEKLPLHIAAERGDLELLKLLLRYESGPQVVDARDKYGMTPLLYSITGALRRDAHELETCESVLMDAGADVSIADNNGWNSLHYVFVQSNGTEMYNFPHCLGRKEIDPIELVSTLSNAPKGQLAVVAKDTNQRTPLHFAAAAGAGVSCLLLMKRGAKLTDQDKDGNTPLALTILKKHVMLSIMLLKSGDAETRGDLVKLHCVHDVERTISRQPLLEAASVDGVETDAWGAKIMVRSRHVETCFWHAASNKFEGLVYVLLDEYPYGLAIADALRCGSFRLARKLLATCRQVDVETRMEGTQFTLLHEVASTKTSEVNWISTLSELLLRRGVDPNATCSEGRTALFYAAERNHVELCKTFLRKGVDPAHPDKDGNTPFLYTLKSAGSNFASYREVLLLLLSRSKEELQDVRVRFRQPRSRTLISEPFQVVPGPNVETVLKESVRAKTLQSAPPTTEKVKSSPLIEAVLGKQPEMVLAFLDANASIMFADEEGFAPLHHAILSNDAVQVSVLVRLGASVHQCTENCHALPPLLLATHQFLMASSDEAKRDLFRIIQLLFLHGANASATDKDGLTGLHLAVRENDPKLANLFLRAAYSQSLASSMPAPQVPVSAVPNHTVQRVWVRLSQEWVFGVLTKKAVLVHGPSLEAPRNNWSMDRNAFQEAMRSQGEDRDGKLKSALSGLHAFSLPVGGSTWINLPIKYMEDTTVVPVHTHPLVGPVVDVSQGELSMLLSITRNPFDSIVAKLGEENALKGTNERLLAAPFQVGDAVLVACTTWFSRWARAVVTQANSTGTYKVQLLHGVEMDCVPRLLLRPDPEMPANVSELLHLATRAPSVVQLLNAKDTEGRTPLDIAVEPLNVGAYRDKEVANLLKKSFSSSSSDDDNDDDDTPMHLEEEIALMDGLTTIDDEVLEQEFRKAVEVLEKELTSSQGVTPPPVSSVCEVSSANLRVLPIAKDGTYEEGFYNVLMVKVDVKEWPQGLNNFYSMQIVEDCIQGLFILINHWGRIEEWSRDGKHQQTPFKTREEAVVEFCKVFRAKTGNDWEQRDHFEKKPNKYKPIHTSSTHQALPLPSARDTSVASLLPEEVQDAVARFLDKGELERAAKRFGLNQNSMPLGRVGRETILEAEKVLKQVAVLLAEIQTIQDAPKPQVAELLVAMEKVADLSNTFFELMPPREIDDRVRPLNEQSLQSAFDLVNQLKDVTTASQLLMVSHMKRDEINPLDYCLNAAGAALQPVGLEELERTAIEQYFRNTRGSQNDDLVISNVFKLQHVAGKPVSSSVGNHRLLWHGSPTPNMMGLLKDGLKIAPPEAPASGHLYGKGIYCADKFSKSFPYCRASLDRGNKERQPKAYVLLVEVAVGQPKRFFQPTPVEKLPPGFDSTLAVGTFAPEPTKDVVLKGTSLTVPVGQVKDCQDQQQISSWSKLDCDSSNRINALLSSPNTSFPVQVQGLRLAKGDSKGFYKTELRGPFPMQLQLQPESMMDLDEMETSKNAIVAQRVLSKPYSGDNEYVVYDKSLARIRYVVEVTSRRWLLQQK